MLRATSTVPLSWRHRTWRSGFWVPDSTSMPTMKNSLSCWCRVRWMSPLSNRVRAAAFDPRRCSPTTPAPGNGRYAWWIPISWTEGFLQFKSAPLEQVFMQLQHFYGVRINCDSHLTEEIMISGKLELRTGLESALNHLKLLAPISYMRSGEREIDITIRQ